MEIKPKYGWAKITRRRFLQAGTAAALWMRWPYMLPAQAAAGGPAPPLRVTPEGVDLTIAETPIEIDGRSGTAVTINGGVPGPLLRMREGEEAVLRVTNRLDSETSIHWHGLMVPPEMDGVPGVSFPGIAPGETFVYKFTPKQSGTYWYHSHSAFQEQSGHYGPLIIEPAGMDPVAYDREHAIVLSDWTFEDTDRVFARLKKQGDYFNFQKKTLPGFVREARAQGLGKALQERLMWLRMRMNPTDIADVTGYTYTYLANGYSPAANLTTLFAPGERVRLRLVNAGASTYFNVRIPGLPLTIVQADGQNVEPVTVDEFQIAVAETYDVIVTPQADRAYTLFAEAMDRSGYARATLAPRAGMSAAVPPLRKPPERSMVDMGMNMGADMAGMDMGGGNQPMPQDKPGMGTRAGGAAMPDMAGMGGMAGMKSASPIVARHGPDTHGPENTTIATVQRNRLGEPGTGLADVPHRVLVYNDLRALEPNRDMRAPAREIEIHLTGNMEFFIWGMDGKKFSEASTPIFLRYNERVRFILVNDTMMEHPMHLHGVFMELVNAADPARRPRKHTLNVKPAERLSFEVTANESGNWAFHCHFLYHMEAGMFRVVNIGLPGKEGA